MPNTTSIFDDNNSKTIQLTQQLVSRDSVTPNDKGCQQLIRDQLSQLGFKAEHLRFEEVDNLWLRRGDKTPVFCFAGHTDVVPAGDLVDWDSPPFTPTIREGYLYGRGVADMKGSIAAMIVATQRFVKAYPDHKGSIAFLITSDEEGPAKNGTVKVVETLKKRNEAIEWCLVGEPSSTNKVGDTIKNGRRGSLGCELTIIGKQGHVAYPHLANNPIHLAAPLLAELSAIEWDKGNKHFPPTSFQISNIHSGTGATNVIPSKITITFNLRFSTELNANKIINRIEKIINRHQLIFEANWNLSGNPFLTNKGNLVDASYKAIETVQNIQTELSTSGGTSDGRFIASMGCQIIELGPVNKTIHQANESILIQDLNKLEFIYFEILKNLLT